ncbi:MAG: hypothetical protein ACR2QQ_08165 [Gammaproteobacteria bacterium]
MLEVLQRSPAASTVDALRFPVLLLLIAGMNCASAASGDLAGIWQAQRNASQVLPENPLFTAQGREAQNNFDPGKDPYLRCIVYVPRAMIAWQPTRIEIVESSERVWILFEAYHQVRRIFLDGRPPLDGEGPLWLGHSNGRWEGDTLVVDTVNLKAGTTYHWEGLPLSGETRLEERFTRLDNETLEIRIKVTDPVNYEEPWETINIYRADPDAHFFEYECDQVAQ